MQFYFWVWSGGWNATISNFVVSTRGSDWVSHFVSGTLPNAKNHHSNAIEFVQKFKVKIYGPQTYGCSSICWLVKAKLLDVVILVWYITTLNSPITVSEIISRENSICIVRVEITWV